MQVVYCRRLVNQTELHTITTTPLQLPVWGHLSKVIAKQESSPVGCVPPTCLLYVLQ